MSFFALHHLFSHDGLLHAVVDERQGTIHAPQYALIDEVGGHESMRGLVIREVARAMRVLETARNVAGRQVQMTDIKTGESDERRRLARQVLNIHEGGAAPGHEAPQQAALVRSALELARAVLELTPKPVASADDEQAPSADTCNHVMVDGKCKHCKVWNPSAEQYLWWCTHCSGATSGDVYVCGSCGLRREQCRMDGHVIELLEEYSFKPASGLTAELASKLIVLITAPMEPLRRLDWVMTRDLRAELERRGRQP